ncbi:cyclic pyranopterin monophosphate synthase MoaC [Natranaerobius trueperi]|uniref:Cyclic pyranopterin monophosphate synthase n=1 Tax=Natranaerobius trueperi TaxID=759412 RepID=A0A226BYQ1_9FIRM|nr:cyclic pyranopterin monophosphate synthase MoaC [Natranaerobius trueperi]OWZ83902.1 cyclic pyranopterin monophosphate synthase MoaC [Natranaerobius trueperi]
MSREFTHFDESGRARMVNVGEKKSTSRTAIARGAIYMNEETFTKIKNNEMSKGDVLGVAQVAGITGAKKAWDIIPMCHPLFLSGINISFKFCENNCKIEIESTVSIDSKTGVEMEALTAVSTAALTIYDMCKAVDKSMQIGEIRLVKKTGGLSGDVINE